MMATPTAGPAHPAVTRGATEAEGRKLAEITGPAVVTAKGSRRPRPLRGGGQAAAEGDAVAAAEFYVAIRRGGTISVFE